jgi:hypothetical protein
VREGMLASAQSPILSVMSERFVVLVDRDPHRRPRSRWRAAWSAARAHDLSTLSTWSYLRDAMTFGGCRAVAWPVLACALLIALFVGGASVAAVVAGSASGSTQRALGLIGASVVLSEVLTAIQQRRPARRLLIAAAVRVTDLPEGWAVAWIDVPSAKAAETRRRLLDGSFEYVETTYYRGDESATVAAYYRIDERSDHALILVERALGRDRRTVTGITINPSRTARRHTEAA